MIDVGPEGVIESVAQPTAEGVELVIILTILAKQRGRAKEPSPTPFIDPQTFRQKGLMYQVVAVRRVDVEEDRLGIDKVGVEADEVMRGSASLLIRVLAEDTET